MVMILLSGVWVICGVISYGQVLAFFQREYTMLARRNYWEDVRLALLAMLLGPISLFPNFLSFGTAHGLMYRNPHKAKS